MADHIRLSDTRPEFDDDCAAPVWTAVEELVERQFGVQPFDEMNDITHPQFCYVPSRARRERFSIISQHQRFRSDVEMLSATPESSLGPIESDVLRFFRLSNPQLGVLVGGMGGGKSTTLNYLREHHIGDIKTIYCDFDPSAQISIQSPTWAAEILKGLLVRPISDLIDPAEEFTQVWTWALSLDDRSPHHAKSVLTDALVHLRRQLEGGWLSETPEAIALRKENHSAITKDPQQHLTYLALLIDYYLTVKCKGDRSRLLLLIDNVDPLPPKLQYELLRFVSRLQLSSRCKVLIALRPLTYTSNMQAANRTMEFIEHVGPNPLELIESRVRNLIDKADLSSIKVRVLDDANEEFDIGEHEIKHWIHQVLASARYSGGAPPQGMDAKSFIEGICNNSMRSALVIAPKLFSSAVVPFVMPATAASSNDSFHPRIKSQELIRAILVKRKTCFKWHKGRIVDNVFDLGRSCASNSITCKLRLLKRLDASETGQLSFEELRDHVQCFGLSDAAVLDGINAIIDQRKRLAWSDMVAMYESLADSPSSFLKIADAGRFYVNRAIYSLEYVQEVHIDVSLPKGTLSSPYNATRFTDRVSSLYLFLRHLHDTDMLEVEKVLSASKGSDYYKTYGGQLISSEMILSIARQILNIGRSMRGGRAGQKFIAEIDTALKPWQVVGRVLEHEDSDLIRKLHTYRPK